MRIFLTILLCLVILFIAVSVYVILRFPFTHNSTLEFEDIQAIKIIPNNDEEQHEILLNKEQIEIFYALLTSDYENIRGQNVLDKKTCPFQVRISCDSGSYSSWLLYDNGAFCSLNYFLEPRFRLHNYEEVYSYLMEIKQL